MKRILFTLVFCTTLSSLAMASIIPEESLFLVKTAEVEVSLIDIGQKDLFKLAQFSEISNSFEFVTAEETKFIQIFGQSEEMIYQLPVLSRKVRISKELFDKGEYKLGFMFDGYKKVEFTGVKVN